MEIAVFIYCHRLFIADTYDSFRLVLEIHTDPPVFRFYIDENNVMFRKHRMSDAAHFYLDLATVKLCHNRQMLFDTCLDCSRDQFFHYFTAAYDRHLAVNNLLDHVAAMATLVKFYSHIKII